MHARGSIIAAISCALSLMTPTIHASPAPTPEQASQAEKHVELAIAAFGEGRYEDAVREFKAAYELDHNPNHLFNIGRVHEEAGDLAAAVEFYKQFVALPGVQIDHRSAALERIDVLERALATQRAAEQPSEPEPEPEPAPDPEPTPTAEPADTNPTPATKTAQRKAGWAVLGVGAAVLVAGAVTTGLTASASNALGDEQDPGERERLAARGDVLAPTSDVLVIAGGTLMVVGLIVALTARPRRDDRSNALRVEPRGTGFALRF